MSSSIILSKEKPLKILKTFVNIWFIVVITGQFIFALYILGLYAISGLAGDFERWNEASGHGYVENDFLGNIIFGVHIALAAIITIGGPLQLIKKVRAKFPKFHRINGRIYISAAFLISIAGLYLAWIRSSVGGLMGSIFITINGVFIFICAFNTIKYAISRKLKIHRKWAIRLFLAMSGVWFFRVFLMLWLTINQGPVGFDMESFQGPALNMLYVFSYILPVLFANFYFRAKKSKSVKGKFMLSIFIVLLTGCIAIGTFSATMGMWLPRI
ncbi:Predicted membrane protein [Aquimarina amphilecti]|uniref:Predicted membrane protein n=1 Tax=Aquimarina amphilecti TaxID=1038014 RepID=A0A1H7QMY8_AQUAM|nr:DUF2306 domain-containing protein [Aquimarina amphilecti]SEL48637.1 Predicted membrane protein [Aquimarina amphilecti]